MKSDSFTILLLMFFATVLLITVSCSKGSGGGGTPNPCSGVTITVNATVTNTSGAGATNGSISASATGGSGFTFSINGGVFQASGNFTSLSAGTYSITAKDGRGCTGSNSFTVTAADPCTSVSFTVGGTTVSATPCATTADGSITVTTSGGGSGFTYNINNGAFQASPLFSNLAAASYTVGAKESGGCIRTASVSVSPKPAGPLFTAVKAVIQANCAISGCHGNVQAPLFTIDCNIVNNGALIKTRAVDQAGTASQMPQPPNPALSVADQNKITNWITAGGKFTD